MWRKIAFASGLLAVGYLARSQAPISTQYSVTIVPQLDVFLTEDTSYTLTATPVAGTPVMLFWTAELLLPGNDYAVTGNQVSILQAGCCSQTNSDGTSNPVIQIMYWKVKP